MNLDKGAPGRHPLGRIGIVGTPYHGLVQGGSLTLPNSAVKTYPQPVTTWPDLAGSTHLLRRAGMPAVSRTLEQQAQDTAKGYQWRNVAMLSGGAQQLYGRNVDGWIYIDPDGVRWLLRFTTPLLSTTVAFGASLSLQVNVSRFGEFGGAEVSFNTTLTLTDWGQSGYTAPPNFPDAGAPTTVTSAGFFLEAVTPSGSKAAICVHYPRTTSADPSDPTVDVAVRHALGWVQIAVTSVGGLPSLSMTVLKTRAETLVTVTNTGSVSPAADSVQPALIAGGGTTTVKTGSSTREHVLKRLVAVWVDPETENWRWVALRYRYAFDTVSAFLGATGATYTVDITSTAEESMALEIDDVEQAKLEITFSGYRTRTATYSGSGSVVITLQNQVGDNDLTIDGVAYDQTLAAGLEDVGNPGENATLDIANYGSGGSLAFSDAVLRAFLFQMQWRFTTFLSLASPEPYQIKIDLCRMSSQVLTLRYHVLSGTLDEFTYFPRITPSGPSGTKTTRPYSVTERLYGSWCPHTGQVASMQATPCCWV